MSYDGETAPPKVREIWRSVSSQEHPKSQTTATFRRGVASNNNEVALEAPRNGPSSEDHVDDAGVLSGVWLAPFQPIPSFGMRDQVAHHPYRCSAQRSADAPPNEDSFQKSLRWAEHRHSVSSDAGGDPSCKRLSASVLDTPQAPKAQNEGRRLPRSPCESQPQAVR